MTIIRAPIRPRSIRPCSTLLRCTVAWNVDHAVLQGLQTDYGLFWPCIDHHNCQNDRSQSSISPLTIPPTMFQGMVEMRLRTRGCTHADPQFGTLGTRCHFGDHHQNSRVPEHRPHVQLQGRRCGWCSLKSVLCEPSVSFVRSDDDKGESGMSDKIAFHFTAGRLFIAYLASTDNRNSQNPSGPVSELVHAQKRRR